MIINRRTPTIYLGTPEPAALPVVSDPTIGSAYIKSNTRTTLLNFGAYNWTYFTNGMITEHMNHPDWSIGNSQVGWYRYDGLDAPFNTHVQYCLSFKALGTLSIQLEVQFQVGPVIHPDTYTFLVRPTYSTNVVLHWDAHIDAQLRSLALKVKNNTNGDDVLIDHFDLNVWGVP